MSWKDLGRKIVDLGAPLLGGVVGGPGGAAVGKLIAEIVGGDPDDPKALAAALERDPQAAVKLQEIQSNERITLRQLAARQAQAEIEAETTRYCELQKTIRAELISDNLFKSGWRPALGWILSFALAAILGAIAWAIFREPGQAADLIAEATVVLTFIAGVLGINVTTRSRDKEALVGAKRTTLAEAIAERIRGGGNV